MLLYILFSQFICIVMLNLLIAIISETFAQVTEKSKSEDLRQVCDILIEFGELQRFICRKKDSKSKPQYLHFLNYLSEIEDDGKADNAERFDGIEEKLTVVQEDVQKFGK
jgi:hypothetical protein